jgi:hypothetical protein
MNMNARGFCGLYESLQVIIESVYGFTFDSPRLAQQKLAVRRLLKGFFTFLSVGFCSGIQRSSSWPVLNANLDLIQQTFVRRASRTIQN